VSVRPLPCFTFLTLALCVHGADTKSMQPMLQSFVDQHIIPGVVTLVADKDFVLALDKAGFASLTAKTPIREVMDHTSGMNRGLRYDR